MTDRAQRSLCAFVVGAALISGCAGPLAPAPKVYRIGYLLGSTQAEAKPQLDAFRASMRDLGYIEGTNVSLEIRSADGYTDRLPALAAELVASRLDILVAQLAPEALALQTATRTIPIVLAGVSDPVEIGLVPSLAQPAGNITGTARRAASITPRRVQLLRDTVLASRLGFLYDAGQPNQVRAYEEARDAAPVLGIAIVALPVRTPEDLTAAFATAAGAHLDALFVGGGPLTRSQQARLVDFVSASRLPSMFGASRDPVDAGGLLFYGESLVEGVRGSAVYVDRILKGARPADLPIEVVSKFDLIINMRTAKALGLTIPPSVLAQATELIQ